MKYVCFILHNICVNVSDFKKITSVMKHYILRYTDLFVIFGIRRNCHSSGKNLLLYQFIKRVIRLIVTIIKESPSYQLPTKFYLTFFWPG
jgi:hypothetical protein